MIPETESTELELRVRRPRRAAPESIVRPTRAEVNLGALRHNAAVLRKAAGSAKLWAVLKADGYGHGSPAVARTLERAKVDGFCVALLEEAIELREAGITLPILVMGGYYGRAYAELAAYDVTPVIYDLEHLQGLSSLVRTRALAPIDVHLKVDTGMARLGVPLEGIDAFADHLAATPEVRVSGLMTHFANADRVDAADLNLQIARFEEATATLAARGIRPPIRHSGNSAALLRGAGRFDAVRPGIAFFGGSPFVAGAGVGHAELEPVMRVRSQIVDVRRLPADRTLGYGSLFCTARDSIIATFAMGYADGLARSASNRGTVLVRGAHAPIVGAVSMDMTMIDVTDLPGVQLGDEVVVLGQQEGPLGKAVLKAEDVAAFSGLIPWEVLTHISRRVPRFYREP